jgi:predicted MFS family arabinose efflux permease
MARTAAATAPEPAVADDAESPSGRTVRGRDFAWFWRGYTVSIIGDQVTLVALPIAVFARTHSALAVGIAASMQAATTLIFGLFAGALADRLRHRPVLIATDLGRAAVLGLVAVMVAASSSYPVVAIYAGAFVLGALRILHDASSGAALPRIVRGRDLLRANSRLNGSESVGNAAGPALAGALIAASVGLAFLVDALSFLLSAVGVSMVRGFGEATEADSSEPASITADIREGLHALRAERDVVRAMLLIAAMNITAITVEAQFIPYANTVLHVGAVAIGVYFALGGAAGVATALVLGRSERTRGDAMIVGVGIFASGVLAAGLFPGEITAALAYVAAGIGSVLALTHFYSLRQRRFPVRILGRVTMATRSVLYVVVPIAYVAGGALARSQGSEALFIAAGCVGLVACAWAWLVGLGSLRVDDISGNLSGPE